MQIGIIVLMGLYLNGQLGKGGISSDNKTDKDLLAILLELHKQHCGDAATCHGNNNSHNEPPLSMFPRPCCIPCSCLPSCEAQLNCCPTIAGVPENSSMPQFSNQSTTNEERTVDNEFVMKNSSMEIDEPKVIAGRNTRTSSRNNMRNPLTKRVSSTNNLEQNATTRQRDVDKSQTQSSDLESNSNGNTDAEPELETVCIKPQLYNRQNHYPDSDAYEMVVSCPPDFDNPHITDKCKNSEDSENIEDVIPVTSNISEVTYINKHCLLCNEPKSTPFADAWQVVLIDEKTEYIHIILENPQSLMTLPHQNYFNVHFVPKNSTSVKRCNSYDVNTCNQTGYWENYDETIQNVCHDGQDLPILSTVGPSVLLFKNIACAHCNSPSDFIDVQLRCNYFERPSLSIRKTLTVNYNAIAEFQKSGKDDKDVTYIKDAILGNLDIGSCPQGFAPVLGRCRKLLCPRDHYMDKNRCIPLYNRITGMGVNLEIKLTPLHSIQDAEIKQVAEALFSAVNSTLEKCVSLQYRDITAWYLAKNRGKTVRCYLFDIRLFNVNQEFLFDEAIKDLNNFFHEFETDNTIFLSNGIKYEVQYEIGHGIQTGAMGKSDLRYPADGYFRLLIDGDQNIPGPKNYLTLTDLYWCIRVEILKTEVERLDRFVFRVSQTGTLLFNDQFDMKFNSDSFVLHTCINYFVDDSVKELIALKRTPNLVNLAVSDSDAPAVGEEGDEFTLDKGLATLAAVFVIAVICIFVFKFRLSAKKRQLQTVEHTQEGIDSSNFEDLSNVNGGFPEPVVTIILGGAKANGNVTLKDTDIRQ